MRTAQERLFNQLEKNRFYFEKSLNNPDMPDIREYLPVSHLMATMMHNDRDWLEAQYPELVLVHMGSSYYEK